METLALTNQKSVTSRPTYWLKTVFDIAISEILLILSLPLVLIICLLILIFDRQKPIYTQLRGGLHGKPFKIFKFSTIKISAEERVALFNHYNEQGQLVDPSANSNITALGRVLRKTHLDELPQIFNIILGQMSLIGPRPFALEEAKFVDTQKIRSQVLPGITGLWQVEGRCENERKFEAVEDYDIEYIKNWGLLFDLKILAKTAKVVLFAKGAH